MMPNADTSTPNLAALEGNIAATRASLDRKIDELERRFDPRRIKMRVRAKLNPEPYLGWIAASAVAVGGVLAARGLRRRPAAAAPIDESWDYIDCVIP
jgi:Protein of unknown function (DUF3618)